MDITDTGVSASHLAVMPVRLDGLIVTFGFDVVDERVQVTEYSIRNEHGAVSVTKRLPLASLAAQALRELRVRWAPQVLHHRPSETAVAAAVILLDTPGPKTGRPVLYPPEHWAQVREVLALRGVVGIAEEWCLSYGTAWRWSRQAAVG